VSGAAYNRRKKAIRRGQWDHLPQVRRMVRKGLAVPERLVKDLKPGTLPTGAVVQSSRGS